MDRSLEGLCNSTYFDRGLIPDHWEGTSRNHRKKLVAWNHVSATQIENYLKCKRAWFFKSILKIPEIQKGHQALGESFHLIMEQVPKGISWPVRADTQATPEEWDKADALAKIALPLLPKEPPNKAIRREWAINLYTYDGGPQFVGYIDLAIPPGIGWPALLVPANEAIVGDYKTLSDFRYMKTPEELTHSVQMMSYGKWAIQEWPSGLIGEHDPIPEHIRLLHLYARTKGKADRQAIRHESAVVTPDEINSFWNKTLDTVREMQQTATCISHEQVEAGGALNGHCEAYGGCSYRAQCGLAKETNIKTLFQITKKPTAPTEDPNMSGSNIIAKIQAARLAQGLTGTTPVATEQTVVANNPEGLVNPKSEPNKESEPVKPSGPISGLMAKISQQGRGLPALGGAVAMSYGKEIGSTAQGYAGGGELGSQTVFTLGDLMKLAAQAVPGPTAHTGIVPPDAPPREQPVITKPGDQVVEETNLPTEEGDEDEGSTSATGSNVQVATSSVASVSVTSSIPEVAKKRGRPSKEEMAAREAAAKAEFEARVQAEVAKRVGQGVTVATVNDPIIAETIRDLEKDVNALKAELDTARKQLHDLKNKPQTISGSVEQGCTLYIDCFPMKGESELVDFFIWIQPIAAAVAESNGVKDWRLIDYKGKGLLATHIRELIRAEGLPKAMSIPTYAGGADIALEILTPLAKRIIRKLS